MCGAMDDPSALVPLGHAHERVTWVRWRLLGVLVLASFVAYLLRLNVSIAGPSMAADLGMSRVQLGIVLAAFAWGYTIFQLPGGIFGDAVGPRKALALVVASWGVVNLLTGLVPRISGAPLEGILVGLVVLRFAMGGLQAPLFPVMAGGAIANWFPVDGRALPNGLSSTGLTLGAAAAGPLIVGLTEAVGWRLSFALTAPLAFATAGIWWWYGRDRPAEHPGVGRLEAEAIGRERSMPPATAESWTIVLRDRNVLLLTLSYFCMNYVFYIFFNWFFVYLIDVRGFSALASGYLAAAPWVVGAVGATVGGLWCDRLSGRIGLRWGCRVPCLLGLGLVTVFLLLGATASNPYVAVLFLSLCFGCTQLTDGAYWAATASVAGHHAASASGILNTGGNLVGGIGALVVPITARSLGWVTALGTGSAFALLGAVLWLWIRADEAPA